MSQQQLIDQAHYGLFTQASSDELKANVKSMVQTSDPKRLAK
ncbi:hypothetical protein [Paraglaciecola psychrophila]|uniref:Uncharacterized protein n=1 Tax=Paraglaciecola psychrophila 170 TaxID=1129794 RepID=K6YY40_9ALTE|nr:hypothetical protein [Paraglaciecola psychrophila]AGH42420.1 hypothetical protein C427_0310 [Paraglaciecola psychrophila 170]GAC37649.1 hypothetical protein GPSY_2027 [Paraglaciecola psychrophila 170]